MPAPKSDVGKDRSYWIPVALVAIAAVVRPWGDYPLNDDWQYARIVKRLAETGRFLVDVDIAPSLVAQAWLAAPFVRILGFSHLVLRVLTTTVAAGLLWIVDRILKIAGANRAIRILASALLLANPIFLHLTFSFMTEIYGYGLALGGALVWLNGRAQRRADEPVIGWRDGLIAATLIGASFWIRQLCVAVFPALLGATALDVMARRDRRAVITSAPVIAASTAWFSAVVLSYFVWAKASGNYVRAFNTPLGSLLHIDTSLIVVSSFELAAYLTMFLFPFLVLERWRSFRWPVFSLAAVAIAIAIAIARAVQPHHLSFHHHLHFPFSANIVNDTGVGPITFTSTYWESTSPRPRWPTGLWTAIEWLLLVGMILWSRLVSDRAGEPRTPPLTVEVRNVGLLLAGIGFALSVQAYQWQVLDRYYLPCILGALIALAARAARFPSTTTRPSLALAATVPLAWFTIAGVHDYFRWNDARWHAVALAEADGGRHDLIDGGYEVNGWLNYDAARARTKPHDCRGACSCAPLAFFCTDDSYVISMELPPGRTALATLPVSWWLADGPPIILSRR